MAAGAPATIGPQHAASVAPERQGQGSSDIIGDVDIAQGEQSTVAAGLLADCAAAPDDDGPRLVWADAVGGERGELVVLQCALARGDGTAADVGARLQRQRALLAANGARWSGLRAHPARVPRCAFHRGFVEAAMLDLAAVHASGDALLAVAPLLRAITIEWARPLAPLPGGGALVDLGRLFAHRAYGRVTGLALGRIAIEDASEGEAVELAVGKGALAQLRAFAIDALGVRGGRALARSGQLAGLERLALCDHVLDLDTARALLAAAPRLRALEITGALSLADLAPALPRTLRALNITTGTAGGSRPGRRDELDGELRALAVTPLAEGLEALRFEPGALVRDTALLAAFPNLRSLDLAEVEIRREAIPSLAACVLPALRALRIRDLGEHWNRELGWSFGETLDLFDLLCTYDPSDTPYELRATVAGDLRIGVASQERSLLHVGDAGRCPPWDNPDLVFTR